MTIHAQIEFAIADIVREVVRAKRPEPVKAPRVTSTFAQLARQAMIAAHSDAAALTDMEVLAAQTGSEPVKLMLHRAKEGSARMGELYSLMVLLIPYEREVRTMIMAPADQPDMTIKPKPPVAGKASV